MQRALVPPSLARAVGTHRQQLALRMHLVYEPELAGGAEHRYASELAPRAHLYLSDELSLLDVGDASDDGVVVVRSHELAAGVDVLLPFAPWHVNRSLVDEANRWPLPGARPHTLPDAEHRWTLPADTYVCAAIVAHTATESGRPCDTRAGNSFHLLSELLASPDAQHRRVEWQLNGDVPLAKGFLSISRVTLVSLADDVIELDYREYVRFDEVSERALFHGDEETMRLAEDGSTQLAALVEHANRAMQCFFGKNALLARSDPSYMRPLHCPYYLTAAGMLDGSMYALNAPRRVPPALFYERALDAVLLRNDARASDLLLAIEAQRRAPTRLLESTRYVEGKIYGELFTVFANALPYLNDFVNDDGDTLEVVEDSKSSRTMRFVRRAAAGGSHAKETIAVSEDYKIARLYHGDDCEGVALEIHMEARQFARVALDAYTSYDSDDEGRARVALLRHFQQLSHDCVYVPTMPLAAVTNKSLDHEKRELDESNVLAHTFTALVPTALLLERLDGDAQLVAAVRSSHHVRTYLASRPRAYDRERDVLTLEGTARASAFQVPIGTLFASAPPKRRAEELEAAKQRIEAQYALMRADEQLASLVAFEVIQRRIDDASGDYAADRQPLSDFYQTVSSVYTASFADVGVLDLALARRQRDGSLTHSLHYNKFAATTSQRSDEWRFVPYNRIDAAEGARAERILSRLEPVPSLSIDDSTARPPAVAAFARLRTRSVRTGAASAILRTDPRAMPGVPRSIVVTVRAEEVEETDVAVRLVAALRDRDVRVVPRYLADAPVCGDELPPVMIYDVEIRLD